MNLCTVIAAPSLDGEGSSAVIKEAIILGTPVVASDLPGNVEVLGGAGVAVPVADAATLAEAVTTMLEEPNRRADTDAFGQSRCEQWFPSTMASGVLAAYDGLGQSVVLVSETI